MVWQYHLQVICIVGWIIFGPNALFRSKAVWFVRELRPFVGVEIGRQVKVEKKRDRYGEEVVEAWVLVVGIGAAVV